MEHEIENGNVAQQQRHLVQNQNSVGATPIVTTIP